MKVRLADRSDSTALARLLWRSHAETTAPTEPAAEFEKDLRSWSEAHRDTHAAFVAINDVRQLVGMAWLATLPRVPRPDGMSRRCGDVQSMYVLPEFRSLGVGTALVDAVLDYATKIGLEHISVNSSPRAVSLYERAGFESAREVMLLSLRPGLGVV